MRNSEGKIRRTNVSNFGQIKKAISKENTNILNMIDITRVSKIKEYFLFYSFHVLFYGICDLRECV